MRKRLSWIVGVSLIALAAVTLPFGCNRIGPGGAPPAAAANEAVDSAPPGIKKGVKVVAGASQVMLLSGVVVDVRGKWVCIKPEKGNERWLNFDLVHFYEIEK